MPTLSNRALTRIRKLFGYATVMAALGFVASLAIDAGDVIRLVLFGAALFAVFGWWWFDDWLRIRQIARQFEAPHSDPERDPES